MISSKFHISEKYWTFDDITKYNVIGAVSIISLTGYNNLVRFDERKFFFQSDFKVVLMVTVLASLKRLTFLLGLSDLDNFVIFIFLYFFFFSIFQKICKISKNVSKNKPIISSCFWHIKKKIIKKLLKSILQKFLFK